MLLYRTPKKHEHQSSGDQTPPQQQYCPPAYEPQMSYMDGSAPHDPASWARLRSPYDPRTSYASTSTYTSESVYPQSPTKERSGIARDMTPNGQMRELA